MAKKHIDKIPKTCTSCGITVLIDSGIGESDLCCLPKKHTIEESVKLYDKEDIISLNFKKQIDQAKLEVIKHLKDLIEEENYEHIDLLDLKDYETKLKGEESNGYSPSAGRYMHES